MRAMAVPIKQIVVILHEYMVPTMGNRGDSGCETIFSKFNAVLDLAFISLKREQ